MKKLLLFFVLLLASGMAMALEIYASQDAYKKHIASEHFQKYKQGTLHMVKYLDLIDTNPLNPLMSISSEIADK